MGVKCLWSPEENSISPVAAVKQEVFISFPVWALVIELRSSVGVVSSLTAELSL